MRAIVGFILLLLGLGSMAVVMQEVGESQDLDRLAEAAARHGDWIADILADMSPDQISRMLDIMDSLGIDAQEILLGLAETLAEEDMETLLDVLDGLTPEQQAAFLEALAELQAGKDFDDLTPEQQAALARGSQNYDGDPEDYAQMMEAVEESGQEGQGGEAGGSQGEGSGNGQGNGVPIDGVPTATEITQYPESVSKGSPFTVRGKVTSAEGPVVGMPVRLYVNETKQSVGQRIGDGQTDANGAFAIDGMLPDDMPLRPGVEYQFVAWGRPFIGTDQAYGGSWSDPPFVIESETTIRLSGPTLAGPGDQVIQGWLEDLDGAPVQDAFIDVDGPTDTFLQTDDNGAFSYASNFPNGDHVVTFSFDGADGMAGSDAQWELTIQQRILEGIPSPWIIAGNDLELDVQLVSDGQAVPGEEVILSMQSSDGDGVQRIVSFDATSTDEGRLGFDEDLARVPYGNVEWTAEDSTGMLGSGTLWHQQEIQATVVSRYLIPNEPGAMWVQVSGDDGPVEGVELLVDGVVIRSDVEGHALIPAAGPGSINAVIVDGPAVVGDSFTIVPEERFLPVLTADNGRLRMEPEGVDDDWRPYAPVLSVGDQSFDGQWSRGRLTFDTELSPGRYDVQLAGVYPDTITSMSVQVPIPTPATIPWLLIGGIVAFVVAAVGGWYGYVAIRRSAEKAIDASPDVLSWTVDGAPEGMPWFSDADANTVTVRVAGEGKARVRIGSTTRPVEGGLVVFDDIPPGQHNVTVFLRKGLRLHRSGGILVRGSPQDALVRTFQMTAQRYQANSPRPLSVGDMRRILRAQHQENQGLEPLNVVEAIMYDGRQVSPQEAFQTAEQIRRLADG